MKPIYESPELLAEYLLFHYGTADEILPPNHEWPEEMRAALGFPVRVVKRFSPGKVARGLDLGCAVGRSAFEMAKTCGKVTGVDFSNAFIHAAEALREGFTLPYERKEEGALHTELVAHRPEGIDPARVEFLHGDAMDLPDGLGSFDRVLAANLLCRLPEPRRLLLRLPDLVKPGGELLLATPCSWLEDFTPRENWPHTSTLEWLKSALSPYFSFVRQSEEPFLIRETARKFQWSISMTTVWRRRML